MAVRVASIWWVGCDQSDEEGNPVCEAYVVPTPPYSDPPYASGMPMLAGGRDAIQAARSKGWAVSVRSGKDFLYFCSEHRPAEGGDGAGVPASVVTVDPQLLP